MEPLPACSLRLGLSLSPAAFYGTPLASFKRSRAHRNWQANELHAATLASPTAVTCEQQEVEQEKENGLESASKSSPHFRTPVSLPLTTQAAVLCSRWPYLPPPPPLEPATKEDEVTPAFCTRERHQQSALQSPLALLPPPLGPLRLSPQLEASGEKPRRAHRHTDALRALAAAAAANCTIDLPLSGRSFRAAPGSLSPVLVKPSAASVRPRAISSSV
jgi:hypothetical protein